jgi:fucose 4-O-acetylase-like acetyltransferase
MNRIGWIDFLRGLSMMLILVFHTEVYYKEYDVTPYYIYVTNAIILFYFISGYLFYRPESFSLKKKLKAIVRSLLIPYFIFTSLIAVPKLLVRQEAIDVQEIVIDILTGQASWYVSALIVAELLFLAVLRCFGNKSFWLAAVALLMLVAAALFGNRQSSLHNDCNFWHVNEAMMGFFLMTVGYFFHQNEKALTKVLFSRWGIFVLTVLFVLSKYIILSNDMQVVFGPIIVSDFFLFIADLLVAVFLLVGVFMKLRSVPVLTWVGQRSIVYYFICGGVPLVLGRLFVSVGFPYSNYLQLFVVFAAVCLFATVMVWLVYRYTHIVRHP